jgi:ribonuclease HI
MYWIRGHAGIPGNELADDLARQGMEGRTTADWLNTDSDGMDN